MVGTVEILRGKRPPRDGEAILVAMTAAVRAAGAPPLQTSTPKGESDLLMLFGVGVPAHDRARRQQIARGGKALLWDLGYFASAKARGYVRFSIDRDHPQHLMDRVPADPSRFLQHNIELREDAHPDGPIILVGLGMKARAYLGHTNWEERTFSALARRFPGRRIVYRPKRPEDQVRLPCERAPAVPIEEVLRGASLVVCRHSNVAIDAAIAGVPFEAEDGAAMWLKQRAFTPANRLEFLQRLAWFQWHPTEARAAWNFIRSIA